MRRIVLGVLLVAVFVVVGRTPASAQINAKLTLPFAFQVEDTVFPAGTYAFAQENPNRKLTIRGKEAGTFATTSLPSQDAFEKETTWLVFRRYGNKYFLAEIWSRHIGREMPVSSAEKELRDSGQQATEVKVNLKM